MGIRGLESYIERHCPMAMEVVDIKKLADDYKRKTNRIPIIVMDIASCVRPIYSMFGIDWLLGGEFKELEEALKKFIKSFTDIGIKLAVVFDAGFPASKHETWCLRMKDHLVKVSDIFRHLNRNSSPNQIPYERFFTLPPGVWSVVESVFMSDENCHCWHSVREADEEVAEYAVLNDCFGILARDTDFIIFTMNQYYFSMKHLNLENMTTRSYSGKMLAAYLKIDVSQLPLFATLCGNDTVRFDDVKYFHQKYCPTWAVGRIPSSFYYPILAEYVQSLPYGRGILKVLDAVSQEVFQSDEFVPRLRESLESYWISPDSYYLYFIPYTGHKGWDEILKKAYERHVKNKAQPQIYTLLIGDPLRYGPSCEDYLSLDILPSPLALMALRKRQYGILFLEKPSKMTFVTEWLTISNKSLDAPFLISPWFSTNHPGLLKLWDDEDESLNEVRWKTFCKAISLKLDHKKVMSIPRNLVLFFLSVFFLQKEINYRKYWSPEFTPLFEKFEIDAFIAQAIFVSRSSTQEIVMKLKELECHGDNSPCYPRAVHLVALFQRTACQLLTLATCCGSILSRNEASTANYFSGKMFHALYRICKEGGSGKSLINGVRESEILYDRLFKMIVDV